MTVHKIYTIGVLVELVNSDGVTEQTRNSKITFKVPKEHELFTGAWFQTNANKLVDVFSSLSVSYKILTCWAIKDRKYELLNLTEQQFIELSSYLVNRS